MPAFEPRTNEGPAGPSERSPEPVEFPAVSGISWGQVDRRMSISMLRSVPLGRVLAINPVAGWFSHQPRPAVPRELKGGLSNHRVHRHNYTVFGIVVTW